jgi:carboxymethylenebutenolidase
VKAPQTRPTLDYLQRYLIEEMIEEYKDAHIPRREMVRRVLLITGSIPATASILLAAGCGGNPTPTLAPTAAPKVATPATPAGAASPAAASPTSATPAASPAVATPATRPPAATPTGTPTRAASPAGSPAGRGSPTPAASGVTIPPTDPAIEAGPVEFPGQGVTLKGYRSSPRGVAKAPGLLVIHENRGLVEHIKDVTRRYAKDGYLAVAVDLVSRQGGTDSIANQGDIPTILGQGDKNLQVQDLLSGIAYLKTLPNFAGPKAGVVGYCYGGGLTWLTAINSADVAAAVPYYGPPPDPLDDVQKITGAVLAFYGELDTRITSNEPAIAAAMQKYNKIFEFKIYPGANHAFNNDTGQSYNAAASKDAYARSLDWFAKYLKA